MTLSLNNLHPAKGSTHKKKRLGRGPGSGTGKTAGRGEKGQKSRSGYSSKIGFEGGQMPLHRRLPKRGFTNIFKKEYTVVNLTRLAELGESNVTPEVLYNRGILKSRNGMVKILGVGELTSKITVTAHKFSASAQEKITKAGGKAEVIA